jgi:hypothetical protein
MVIVILIFSKNISEVISEITNAERIYSAKYGNGISNLLIQRNEDEEISPAKLIILRLKKMKLIFKRTILVKTLPNLEMKFREMAWRYNIYM